MRVLLADVLGTGLDKDLLGNLLIAFSIIVMTAYGARGYIWQRGDRAPQFVARDNGDKEVHITPPKTRRQISVRPDEVPDLVRRLRTIFNRLDCNGDGMLEPAELKHLEDRLADHLNQGYVSKQGRDGYVPRARQRAQETLARIDRPDPDVRRTVVREDEVLDVEQLPVATPGATSPPSEERRRTKRGALLWSRVMDVNQDGVIDFEEFLRHFLFMHNDDEEVVPGSAATRSLVTFLEEVLEISESPERLVHAARHSEIKAHQKLNQNPDAPLEKVMKSAVLVFGSAHHQHEGRRSISAEELRASGLLSWLDMWSELHPSPGEQAALLAHGATEVTMATWLHFAVTVYKEQRAAELQRTAHADGERVDRLHRIAEVLGEEAHSDIDRLERVRSSIQALVEHNAQLVAAEAVLRMLSVCGARLRGAAASFEGDEGAWKDPDEALVALVGPLRGISFSVNDGVPGEARDVAREDVAALMDELRGLYARNLDLGLKRRGEETVDRV
jgi:hypothetical protein